MLKIVIYDISKYYFINKSHNVIRVAFPFKFHSFIRAQNWITVGLQKYYKEANDVEDRGHKFLVKLTDFMDIWVKIGVQYPPCMPYNMNIIGDLSTESAKTEVTCQNTYYKAV